MIRMLAAIGFVAALLLACEATTSKEAPLSLVDLLYRGRAARVRIVERVPVIHSKWGRVEVVSAETVESLSGPAGRFEFVSFVPQDIGGTDADYLVLTILERNGTGRTRSSKREVAEYAYPRTQTVARIITKPDVRGVSEDWVLFTRPSTVYDGIPLTKDDAGGWLARWSEVRATILAASNAAHGNTVR
jgi:hypothetical protein